MRRWLENEGNVRVKCQDFCVYTLTRVYVKWVGFCVCVYIIRVLVYSKEREITSGQKSEGADDEEVCSKKCCFHLLSPAVQMISADMAEKRACV